MEPIKFPESNYQYPAKEGEWTALDTWRGTRGETTPVVISAWKPSEEEKEQIMNGGVVYLEIVGVAQPPVCLYTANPFTTSKAVSAETSDIDSQT